MNLTSLISKSAKSLALLAMLAAMPMAASAEEMAKTPASQLTYEPQLDNQRDPNQYCAIKTKPWINLVVNYILVNSMVHT